MGRRRKDRGGSDPPSCVHLHDLPLPTFVADTSGRIVAWNRALAELARSLGHDPAALSGAAVVGLLGRDVVWGVTPGSQPRPVEVTVTDGSGARRTLHAHASGLAGTAAGVGPGSALVTLVEASDRPAATDERRAPRIVQWSELTDRIREIPGPAVCATFGLVGLDAVNSGYSRSTGDHVLTRIAARLGELAPPGAVVERTGGERFVVVAAADSLGDHTDHWARVVVGLRSPVDTPLGRVAVGSSVGVATGDPRSGLVLLEASERRLESALRRGAGIVEERRSLARTPTVSARYAGDLVEAVASGGVRAHFQPVVDLLSTRVVEFEALARWDGTDDVHREAAEFIAAAADTGVIVPMGEGVLRDAVELARSIAATIDDRPFAVSVNVSLRELLDPAFLDVVDRHLRRGGVRPWTLQIEVAADIPAEEVANVSERLVALRGLGVRTALDNVGGARSSLLVLRDLDVDVVKLDPALVERLGTTARAEHVLRAVLDLGRQLGVVVVAKGVERTDQHENLRALGCRYAQGYLYGGATPALELPFGDLVGAHASRLVGDPRRTERETLVSELIAHGAFDHSLLDDLVADAAASAGTEIAAVGVVERDLHWFASRVGIGDTRVPPASTMCALVVESDRPVVVDDLESLGADLEGHTAFLLGAGVRGYVGMPVRLRSGHVVAVLCVMWETGGGPDGDDLSPLVALAEEVARRVEVRALLAGARLAPPRAHTAERAATSAADLVA